MKKRELEAEGKPLAEPGKNEKRPRSSSYNYHKNGTKPASPVKQVSATPNGSSEFNKPVYKTIHSIETEMLSRSSSNIQNNVQGGYIDESESNGEKKNPFLNFKINMAPLMRCFDTQKVK